MKIKRTAKVRIADLKQNLFVRKALDNDHAFFLAELVENGTDLGPILVSEDFTVVDGRHRIEAMELNKFLEIDARIATFDSDAELISEAYKANAGGSKPPTAADTEHTVELLLGQGESMKRIGELLGLPVAMARRFATDIKSRINRAKLQRAAASVTDGNLTVVKAAEQHSVDVDKLKEILSGRRQKGKKGIQELHRGLSTLYNGLGVKNGAMLKKILEKYEDGDVTEAQVRELFTHIEDLQKKATRKVADWKKRFVALTDGKKLEVKVAKTA